MSRRRPRLQRAWRRRLVTALIGTVLAGPVAAGYPWQLPPGFPAPAVPIDNPQSQAKVTLGHRLFFDPRLSANGTLACAGCHQPALAFTDGRAQAVGATGARHRRSTMSLVNVAYNATLTWADPSVRTLEQQARIPLFNRHPIEMGMAGAEGEILDRLAADPWYQRAFRTAFPTTRAPVRVEQIVRALASYQRTLIAADSPYDRYVYRDDRTALGPAARRGMALFFDERLGCSGCHGGFLLAGPARFAEGPDIRPTFHNTALYNLRDRRGRPGFYPARDRGLREVTGRRRDDGRFRAPTLRNIARTAPYMHDGSVATLEAVIEHYAAGGRSVTVGPEAGVGADNPRRSPRVRGFAITPSEVRDLMAFLRALTDESLIGDPRFQAPHFEESPVK